MPRAKPGVAITFELSLLMHNPTWATVDISIIYRVVKDTPDQHIIG